MLLRSCCDRRSLYHPDPCGCSDRYCARCILCERHCGCGERAQVVVIEEVDEDADEPKIIDGG
jgi:hypothetical protein